MSQEDFSNISQQLSNLLGEQINIPNPTSLANMDIDSLRDFGSRLNVIEAKITAQKESAIRGYELAKESYEKLRLKAKEQFGVCEVEEIEAMISDLEGKWEEGSLALKAKLEEYASVPTEVSDEELDKYMLTGEV